MAIQVSPLYVWLSIPHCLFRAFLLRSPSPISPFSISLEFLFSFSPPFWNQGDSLMTEGTVEPDSPDKDPRPTQDSWSWGKSWREGIWVQERGKIEERWFGSQREGGMIGERGEIRSSIGFSVKREGSRRASERGETIRLGFFLFCFLYFSLFIIFKVSYIYTRYIYYFSSFYFLFFSLTEIRLKLKKEYS